MVILILFDERDEQTGKKTGRTLVSHGVDVDTLENIPLPPDPPNQVGWYHEGIREWVLKS